MATQHEHSERRRINVAGIVQGMGFRPFVFRLANEIHLTGFVRNDSAGVMIEAEGTTRRLDEFVARLPAEAPPLARIDSLEIQSIPLQREPVHSGSSLGEFRILLSIDQPSASTPVSPDVAACDECLAEMRDPGDRRYGYPFINCTNCGPRFTILRGLPYDRQQTTMSSFVMCPLCSEEYGDPANRRFHAQPNACPTCGPKVWFETQSAEKNEETNPAITGAAAIDAFHSAIAQGLTVAVRGIGGFHFACDAMSDEAVRTLRFRKGRADKPFAVMVANIDAARRFAEIHPAEERLLRSPARPIVLLKQRTNAGLLSKQVAPGNNSVGVMLPDSPLQHLLIASHTALVMTSGNLSEEPVVRTNDEARAKLAGLADAFLLHDREIFTACDDSVVRAFRGRELPIRRSRGFAPMPICIPSGKCSVLAMGGELKETFCVTKQNAAYMSQHIGDMGNLGTLRTLERSVGHFCELFRVTPDVIACDMHPGYLSANWGKQYALDLGIPVVEVQHHHAHIAALRAEYDCREPVIGICFDGTGYGLDGAIWGGEVLKVSDHGFERLAHLRYCPLAGGDASIKRPYRIALAQLLSAGIPWNEKLPCLRACPEVERPILKAQLEKNVNCVPTSSMGRLFDAVASLIGIRHVVSYEAQASIELEAASAVTFREPRYRFQLSDDMPIQIDPTPVLAAIVDDVLRGEAIENIGGHFHTAVASLVQEICRRIRNSEGLNTVALSGGVFQNALLLKMTKRLLEEDGMTVLIHRLVPPNDGGLALGQAVIAQQLMADQQEMSG